MLVPSVQSIPSCRLSFLSKNVAHTRGARHKCVALTIMSSMRGQQERRRGQVGRGGAAARGGSRVSTGAPNHPQSKSSYSSKAREAETKDFSPAARAVQAVKTQQQSTPKSESHSGLKADANVFVPTSMYTPTPVVASAPRPKTAATVVAASAATTKQQPPYYPSKATGSTFVSRKQPYQSTPSNPMYPAAGMYHREQSGVTAPRFTPQAPSDSRLASTHQTSVQSNAMKSTPVKASSSILKPMTPAAPVATTAGAPAQPVRPKVALLFYDPVSGEPIDFSKPKSSTPAPVAPTPEAVVTPVVEKKPQVTAKPELASPDTDKNDRDSAKSLVSIVAKEKDTSSTDAVMDELDAISTGVFPMKLLLSLKSRFTSPPEALVNVAYECMGWKTAKGRGGGSSGFRQTRGHSGAGPSHRGSRGGRRGGHKGAGGRKHFNDNERSVRAAPPKPLEHSESGWVKTMPKDEVEELTRKIQDFLNKLTGKNFDAICVQLMEVVDRHVSDPSTLKIVVNQIFDRALFEPNFSEMYSELCERFLTKFPEFTVDIVDEVTGAKRSEQYTFNRLLLFQCQMEFQSGMTQLVFADSVEEESRTLAVAKQKQRWLGNIIFIGELFKKQLISKKIMKACIAELLKNAESPEEEDLEALCKLMNTVGGSLEAIESDFVNACFVTISNLINGDNLPSGRIRFLLMDVADLKANNWVSREDLKKAAPAPRRGIKIPPPTRGSGPARRGGKKSVAPLPRSSTKILPRTSAKPSPRSGGSTSTSLPSNMSATSKDAKSASTVDTAFRAVDSRVDNMIKEYFNALDFEEVKMCVEELGSKYKGDPQVYLPLIVTQAASLGAEGSSKDRDHVFKLLRLLSESKLLPEGCLYAGFRGIFETVNDFSIDCPSILPFCGELLAFYVTEDWMSVDRFGEFWVEEAVTYGSMEKVFTKFYATLIEDDESVECADGFDITLFLKNWRYAGFAQYVDFKSLDSVFGFELKVYSLVRQGLTEQDAGAMIAGRLAALDDDVGSLPIRAALEFIACDKPDDFTHLLDDLEALHRSSKDSGQANLDLIYEIQKLYVKLQFPKGIFSSLRLLTS